MTRSSADLSNSSLYSSFARPFAELPRNNPCAQCGTPIALPEWVERTETGAAYLWHCSACDYRFEAVAVFPDARSRPRALAA